MKKREKFLEEIHHAFEVHPVIALLGPRQCGKTTLAKQYEERYRSEMPFTCFDMENPRDLAKFSSPLLTLEEISNQYIVIDEIQRREELFPILRVLVDQKQNRNFLILGSASRDLIRQSSETLAGRIRYIELTPFSFWEVLHADKLWLRGGFPLSFLAKTDEHSVEWRSAYIATFLERDIPNLGIHIPAPQLRRFWTMLGHYHGQICNSSEIGASLGISHTTVRRYLDILTGTFMIRQLQPWFENIEKRQVKSPKIYFRDSGIFHTLLDINDRPALLNHPKLGASWEGFALEEVIRFHEATSEEAYFWAIHNQAELDLLIVKEGRRLGFEFKYADSPTLTKSMQIATELLKLDQLTVIFPGKEQYPLSKNARAIGLESYLIP
jgi:predicted AAA+ superfamily ATPase